MIAARVALGLALLAWSGCVCRSEAPPAVELDCVPAPEICNAADDDCDGEVDEGAAPCDACCDALEDADACEDDARVCTPGGAAVCEDRGAAIAERCDGVDADCDGLTDEVRFGLCTDCCDSVEDLDGCLDDDRACLPDGTSGCVDAGPALEELCNQVDDDCDGITDEGFEPCVACCDAPGGDLCLDDARACDGTDLVCVDVGGELIADCCDGVDDDCDGAIDEDCGPYGCP